MSSIDQDWCILRTAPSRTVPLAAALIDARFTAWTPTEVHVQRVGRSRKRVEKAAPLTPTFVFADYARLGELLMLSKSPSMTYQVWDSEQRRMVTMGIPYFTVFRYLDVFPSIADRALDPLRSIVRRRKPHSVAREFHPGDEVRYPDAGFEALTGVVHGMKGRFAMVLFPGFPIAIQIDARYLMPNVQAA